MYQSFSLLVQVLGTHKPGHFRQRKRKRKQKKKEIKRKKKRNAKYQIHGRDKEAKIISRLPPSKKG